MEIMHKMIYREVFDHLPEPTTVLGVGASPRKNGNSDVLLSHILKGTSEYGAAAYLIQLRNMKYDPCVGCEKCRKDKICTGLTDAMTLTYPLVYQSRGLILVSPTHNYNITAWMKAFIDRLYCFYDFEDTRPRAWSSRLANQNRKAVLAAVAEQEDEFDMGFTLEAMRRPLQALGYEVVGQLPVYGIFERGGVKKNEDALLAARKLGSELSKALLS